MSSPKKHTIFYTKVFTFHLSFLYQFTGGGEVNIYEQNEQYLEDQISSSTFQFYLFPSRLCSREPKSSWFWTGTGILKWHRDPELHSNLRCHSVLQYHSYLIGREICTTSRQEKMHQTLFYICSLCWSCYRCDFFLISAPVITGDSHGHGKWSLGTFAVCPLMYFSTRSAMNAQWSVNDFEGWHSTVDP